MSDRFGIEPYLYRNPCIRLFQYHKGAQGGLAAARLHLHTGQISGSSPHAWRLSAPLPEKMRGNFRPPAPFSRKISDAGRREHDGKQHIHIVGISGSLRDGSYTTAVLRAAIELKPADVEMEIVTLHDIPSFNEDVEAEGWPGPVAALRDLLSRADGVIFATPEYNCSIPGVLKNAIDWLSRPERKSPIYGKPAAILGATPSMIGTARAQAHLRQVVFYNAKPLLASQEALIAGARDKFDENGRLTDAETRKFVAGLISAFGDWVRLNQKQSA